MMLTMVTGLFSWIDWSCTVFRDIVTHAYSDPRGLLFNLLLFGCLVATLGVASLACLLSSFALRLWSHQGNGLHEHLWGWGFFLLGILNPWKWFPFWSRSPPGANLESHQVARQFLKGRPNWRPQQLVSRVAWKPFIPM
jgi:hypothetical protein